MEVVVGTVLALAALNVGVSAFVIRATSLLRKQKLAQCLLIWLVPFFGAVIVAAFLYSSREPPHLETRHMRNEDDYPGVNLYPPHGPSDHEP
jgi:hypothetical protein